MPAGTARALVSGLALAALAAAAPAHAQMGTRTLVVYPVASASGKAADAADVTALLDAALRRAVQRTDDFVLGEPLFTRAACGPAPAASLGCLAALAGGGVVLRVTVHRSSAIMVVQFEAVDSKARPFGPVTVSVDAFAQSSEPLLRAVLILVDQVSAAPRRSDPGAAVPLPPPPVIAAKPAAPAAPPTAAAEKHAPPPAAKPTPEKPAAALAVRPPPPAPQRPSVALAEASAPSPAQGSWMRSAGPILTGAGAAVLAGGIALSIVNRSLSNELDRKFASGTLTPADVASYERVQRNDKLTRILFGTGGALTLSGVAIWTAAPARGAVAAGMTGTF